MNIQILCIPLWNMLDVDGLLVGQRIKFYPICTSSGIPSLLSAEPYKALTLDLGFLSSMVQRPLVAEL